MSIEPAHAFFVWIKYVAIWDAEKGTFAEPVDTNEGHYHYRSTVGGYPCGRDVERWSSGKLETVWIDFGNRRVSAKRIESAQQVGRGAWINEPDLNDLTVIALLYRSDETNVDDVEWAPRGGFVIPQTGAT